MDKICEEVLLKSNFYEVLGVDKLSEVEVIQKAYRSIVLKVHPDKNSSKLANPAFQHITKAYSCLSNKKFKDLYDKAGISEISEEGFFRNFDENIAGKIFQNEFQNKNSESRNNQLSFTRLIVKCFCLQLLPVIVIMLVYAYTQRSDPNSFSFDISQHYNVRKITTAGRIVYYVNSAFEREMIKDNQESFEEEIEKAYLEKEAKKKIAEGKKKDKKGGSANDIKGNERKSIEAREAGS